MLDKLEEFDRQVWEKQPRVVEDMAHVLGGAGVGLLIYSNVARWARPVGYALMAVSLLGHVYALVAPQSKLGVTETHLRRAA